MTSVPNSLDIVDWDGNDGGKSWQVVTIKHQTSPNRVKKKHL
jgi:hypothetical protein